MMDGNILDSNGPGRSTDELEQTSTPPLCLTTTDTQPGSLHTQQQEPADGMAQQVTAAKAHG